MPPTDLGWQMERSLPHGSRCRLFGIGRGYAASGSRQMSAPVGVVRRSVLEDGSAEEFSSYDEENPPPGPTSATSREWEQAYDFFNAKLFGGALPRCLITYQRRRSAYGYFHGSRFANAPDDAVADEIAMNLALIPARSLEETLSTLVHEQVHLRQFHFSASEKRRGKVRAYHDREWGEMVEAVGLIPSNTDKPGGKKTGGRASHYIAEGGPFQKACAEPLATGFTISWQQQENLAEGGEGGEGGKKRPEKPDTSKVKFTCPVCGQNAWAKHTARMACIATPTCGDVPMNTSTA